MRQSSAPVWGGRAHRHHGGEQRSPGEAGTGAFPGKGSPKHALLAPQSLGTGSTGGGKGGVLG